MWSDVVYGVGRAFTPWRFVIRPCRNSNETGALGLGLAPEKCAVPSCPRPELRVRNTALALLALVCAPLFAAHSDELTPEQQQGKTLFNQSCTFCHGERGHATALLRKRLGEEHALLEARTSLSVELVRHVVRHGINSMPVYRRAELSDHELDSIAAYLTRPRAAR